MAVRFCALVIAILCFATPAHAQTVEPVKHLDLSPYVVLLAGKSADIASSLHAFGPNTREANPLFSSKPSVFLLETSALTVGEVVVVRWLDVSGHPKIARWFGYASGIAGGLAAYHNFRLTQRLR